MKWRQRLLNGLARLLAWKDDVVVELLCAECGLPIESKPVRMSECRGGDDVTRTWFFCDRRCFEAFEARRPEHSGGFSTDTITGITTAKAAPPGSTSPRQGAPDDER